MRQQTAVTSRLGFVGRKLTKKAKQELAEQLMKAAVQTRNPNLIKAALNMAQYNK